MANRIRTRLGADTAKQLNHYMDTTGQDIDTVIQLLVAAHQEGDPTGRASQMLNSSSQTQNQIAGAAMAAAPDEKLAGIRLGALAPAPMAEAVDGFDRDYMGADLDTEGAQLWKSTRGDWNISNRPTALAAYRLGLCLTLYCGVTWSPRNPVTGRRYALTGYEIVEDRRIEPDTGRDVGAASRDEKALAAALGGKILSMKTGAQNPVVNLYR